MNATIRQRVDAFVDDLSQLIRKAALEAVHEALGAGQAPAARRGRPARKAAGRPAGSKSAPRSAAGGDVGRVAGALLEEIRRNPGQRLEEIARSMKTTTAILRPALNQLLRDGRVRTEGMARGTRYLAGGGGGAGKKAGARKKAAGKKVGRKKAGKKKAAKRAKKKAGRRKKATRRATAAGPAAA